MNIVQKYTFIAIILIVGIYIDLLLHPSIILFMKSILSSEKTYVL